MVPSGQSYAAMISPQSSAVAAITQRSPWHSPVPYLFGGLAAMLGLIAFALLILACSYWKLSGYLEDRENSGERDLEMGEEKSDEKQKIPVEYEEKVLVIMAGQLKPSCLATPVPSRASSFGSNVSSSSSVGCTEKSDGSVSSSEKEDEEEEEERKVGEDINGVALS
ncbi:protein GLUTAMINE DUMPER 3-like [Impatiens glandulifera]|uniref:protein GLUTAMINE DUMPER 3-like n=1 Tax=Impatiens glandulifera TaxID=253017 RepID=UPI001FB1238C|nr:protein GLUTAMINE DUMPER 3-like [Impatiens glandulifera]